MTEIRLPLLNDDETPIGPAPSAAAVTPADPPLTTSPTHGRKSILRVALEVLLISVGVFLGLMGEQLRERVQHRDLAEVSLRRFRTELRTNRNNVAAVKDKHFALLRDLRSFLQTYSAAGAAARTKLAWPDTGTHPAFLEYAAWELAVATQALVYIDSDLAFSLAHVYAAQRQLDDATRGVTQAMYATGDPIVFLNNGLGTYYGDCTLLEPRLLSIYDRILPRLDRALGEGTPAQGAAR